ncbi:rhodanese-like domain-containing protein [Arthrobacter sp. CAN_C5]|uniref:rhodanese-like domain-containing protein n=1 Tax=Arthrobacter sp. CAN_C5 TaxID=2760706 RepID=UPI001AEA1AE7|nr:rhodanese-like domain-containing protein [Arthrobacter sp. CAN_C5]MBP2217219.1 rhodanese-related sulfurtransferase [Arthrobacter sp. CAN_C5]
MAHGPTILKSVTAQQLLSWQQEHEDVVVIDVRSAAEFASQHIRGACNVPLPLLSEHAGEFASRLHSRVVLVCQSGARAEQARQRLNGVGLDAAYVLNGGTAGFADGGGAVVSGKTRWDLERQVRMTAGSLVLLGLTGGRFLSPKIRSLAGVIGAGLTFSAATNTCAMGTVLSALPWNRAQDEHTRESAIAQLPPRRDSTAMAS